MQCLSTRCALAAAVLATASATAHHQDVGLKDLMPKGMAIGVAINQRQSDGVRCC